MKRAWTFAGLVALLLCMAAPAQAHHASASKIKAGTYWKCTDNYAISKGKTRKTRGTTKIHIHKVKPSKKHMRRHKCIKRYKAPQTITKIVTVPGPERIVTVTLPCNCPPPVDDCSSVDTYLGHCQPTPPEPCADPKTHGKPGHKHKKAKD